MSTSSGTTSATPTATMQPARTIKATATTYPLRVQLAACFVAQAATGPWSAPASEMPNVAMRRAVTTVRIVLYQWNAHPVALQAWLTMVFVT